MCTRNEAVYAVMDGNLMSGSGTVAGYYFRLSYGAPAAACGFRFREAWEHTALADYGQFRILMTERGMEMESDGEFRLEWQVGRTDRHMPVCTFRDERQVQLSYGGVNYAIRLTRGTFRDGYTVCSEDRKVEVEFV